MMATTKMTEKKKRQRKRGEIESDYTIETLSGWKALGESLKIRVSLGVQVGIDVKGVGVGVDLNIISRDFINIDGVYDTAIFSEDITSGIGITVGVLGLSSQQVINPVQNGARKSTTTTSIEFLGLGGGTTTTKYG